MLNVVRGRSVGSVRDCLVPGGDRDAARAEGLCSRKRRGTSLCPSSAGVPLSSQWRVLQQHCWQPALGWERAALISGET